MASCSTETGRRAQASRKQAKAAPIRTITRYMYAPRANRRTWDTRLGENEGTSESMVTDNVDGGKDEKVSRASTGANSALGGGNEGAAKRCGFVIAREP